MRLGLNLFAGAVLALLLAWPQAARAIPPFAREHGVPCSTCHITVTRRNELGDAFRRAGYRWPTRPDNGAASEKGAGEGADGQLPPVQMRGTTPWETLLPARPPIGLAATFAAAYTRDPGVKRALTLGSPSFNLLFGSSLGPNASVFATWAGRGAPNELLLHLARIGGLSGLNLKLGLFEQSTTLFKANEALLGSYLLGSSGLSGHAVSVSRIGAEANGVVGGRLFWALGLCENAGPGTPVDGYYHVGYKVGGLSWRGEEPDLDLDDPSPFQGAWLSLGHWGYLGRVEAADASPVATIRRMGLDAQVDLGRGALWGGVMLGADRDRLVSATNRSVTWFGEASYRINSYLTAMYVYQYQDASSLPWEVQLHDVGLVGLLMENLRARLRVSATIDRVRNESADLQLLVGF
jgi:hypothetical protein